MRAKTSDILNAEEIFINEDYNLDIIFEVNTIIDAGANVGFASIYFTSRFPKSNILAIEPEKSNFKILRKNIRPYKNIKALNLGIWNKKTNLIISNKTKAENWGFMVEETDKSKYDTKAITINDCMNLMNWTAIDILKIDIEGSEKKFFT